MNARCISIIRTGTIEPCTHFIENTHGREEDAKEIQNEGLRHVTGTMFVRPVGQVASLGSPVETFESRSSISCLLSLQGRAQFFHDNLNSYLLFNKLHYAVAFLIRHTTESLKIRIYLHFI
jgi:hypothetical protein